jgi:hypothetical protein
MSSITHLLDIGKLLRVWWIENDLRKNLPDLTEEDFTTVSSMFEPKLVDLFRHMVISLDYKSVARDMNQDGYVDCYIGRDIRQVWGGMLRKIRRLWYLTKDSRYRRLDMFFLYVKEGLSFLEKEKICHA